MEMKFSAALLRYRQQHSGYEAAGIGDSKAGARNTYTTHRACQDIEAGMTNINPFMLSISKAGETP